MNIRSIRNWGAKLLDALVYEQWNLFKIVIRVRVKEKIEQDKG